MNITEKRREKILTTLDKFRVISKDNPISDCYGWTGTKSGVRHPRVNIEGKSIGAHRAAWMAHRGTIPEAHHVRHTCENKSCTNPEHLFLSKKRWNGKKPENRVNNRAGRERLSVDLPTSLVTQIRASALKYRLTVTKYLLNRLSEIIRYEKHLDNANGGDGEKGE